MLKNPPTASRMMKPLLILGTIIFLTFLFLTFNMDIALIDEPAYDWGGGKIAIVNYRILGSGGPNDQITIKNNHYFTILIRELRVNGVDLTGGKGRVLSTGQAITLTSDIGAGTKGTKYQYEISVRYDDLDNSIAGYEWAPAAMLSGKYE